MAIKRLGARLEEDQHANEKIKALKKIEERKKKKVNLEAAVDTMLDKKQPMKKQRLEDSAKGKEVILVDRKGKEFAKGGRAGFKSGSKVCKLAMKGKGRAYGKNS